LKLEENDQISVKIADFGLLTLHNYVEQLHESDVRHQEFGSEVGNGGDYDTKADIYSLRIIAKDLFNIFSDGIIGYCIITATYSHIVTVEPLYVNNERIAESLICKCSELLPIAKTDKIIFQCWISMRRLTLALKMALEYANIRYASSPALRPYLQPLNQIKVGD
jgi:hypothetical protein